MTVASIGLLAGCLRDVLQIFEQQGLDLKSMILGSVTACVQQIPFDSPTSCATRALEVYLAYEYSKHSTDNCDVPLQLWVQVHCVIFSNVLKQRLVTVLAAPR